MHQKISDSILHWGVDLQSFFRAVVVNASSMSFRQGFSTLSQQLARNLYKEVGFRDSITRKLKRDDYCRSD